MPNEVELSFRILTVFTGYSAMYMYVWIRAIYLQMHKYGKLINCVVRNLTAACVYYQLVRKRF